MRVNWVKRRRYKVKCYIGSNAPKCMEADFKKKKSACRVRKGLFGAGNAAPRRNVRMHSPGRGNEVPRGDVPCLRTLLGPKEKYILFVSHVR